jgi:predicted lactoylglutathione lyase
MDLQALIPAPNQPIADARSGSEVTLALSADSRKAVDVITEAAGANGGRADVNPRQEHAFHVRS